MKKGKTPTAVTIAILTTITVFIWVFFDVYRILKKTPVIDVEPKLLEPINPVLDQNSLTEITKRKYFDESSMTPLNLATPIITQEVTPVPATGSATKPAEQIQ
jgi:hypothetical protein